MKCNQICKWNSNAGCVKPYGVPCILENVSPTGRKATNADRVRAMSDEELASWAINEAPKIGFRYTRSETGLLKWLKQPAE